MTERESLQISGDDPNRRDSTDPRDIRIQKLEAENAGMCVRRQRSAAQRSVFFETFPPSPADLLRKLKMAKHVLLKLDAKMKATKTASLADAAAPLLCPVCGFDVRAGAERGTEEEEILVKVEEDMRVSRASRRAPPPSPSSATSASVVPRPVSPRSVSPPTAARPTPRSAVPPRSPPKATLTRLPWRAVFVLVEWLPSAAARQCLALTCQEWARNVRFWARASGRAMRLGLCLKNEEVDYCRGLMQLRTYQREMEKAHVISEDESRLLFANADTLERLSSILLRDLHERFAEWKPGDSVCDVFLIAVQGLRVYASYYANYEVMLPDTMALVRVRPEFGRLVPTLRAQRRLRDLSTLLRSPLDRIESYRVLVSLLQEGAKPPHADAAILQQAATALADAVALMNEARVAKESAVALSKTLSSVRDLPALRTNRDFVELRLLREEECVRVLRGRAGKAVRLILLNTCLVMAVHASRTDLKSWRCDQVFDLPQVVKAEKSAPNVFAFASPDKTFSFQCATEASADSWVRVLRNVDISGGALDKPPKKSISRFATLTKTLRSTK
jgi:hypothetical protein